MRLSLLRVTFTVVALGAHAAGGAQTAAPPPPATPAGKPEKADVLPMPEKKAQKA